MLLRVVRSLMSVFMLFMESLQNFKPYPTNDMEIVNVIKQLEGYWPSNGTLNLMLMTRQRKEHRPDSDTKIKKRWVSCD